MIETEAASTPPDVIKIGSSRIDLAPIEKDMVPPGLITLLNSSYHDIVGHLPTDTTYPPPPKPSICLCSRENFKSLTARGGQAKGFHTVAQYSLISHAIVLPEDILTPSTQKKAKELKRTIYEEMIHALTSVYDSKTHSVRLGFSDPISLLPEEKAYINSTPDGSFKFNRLAVDLSKPSQSGEERSTAYPESKAFTENVTHLARELMIADPNDSIGIAQHGPDPANPKIDIIADATAQAYKEEYQRRSGGKNIITDLLRALRSGDKNQFDTITNTYSPQVSQKRSFPSFNFLKSRADKAAGKIQKVLQGLSDPYSFVFI